MNLFKLPWLVCAHLCVPLGDRSYAVVLVGIQADGSF